MEFVKKFCYFGFIIILIIFLDEEIRVVRGEVVIVFGRFIKRIWNNKLYMIKIKIRMYEVCVLSIFLYCLEIRKKIICFLVLMFVEDFLY